MFYSMELEMFTILLFALVLDIIPLQGLMIDDNGDVYEDGYYSLQFLIYTDSISGSLLWEEKYNGSNKVKLRDGFYSINLGSINSLDYRDLIGRDKWLEIKLLDSNKQLGNRIKLNPNLESKYTQNIIPSAKIGNQLVSALDSIGLKIQESESDEEFFVKKEEKESRINTTSLSEDKELKLDLVPGTYIVRFFLLTKFGEGDIKFGFSYSDKVEEFVLNRNGSSTGRFIDGIDDDASISASNGSKNYFFNGYLEVKKKGKFKLKWAQKTNKNQETYIEQGTFIYLEKVTK